VRYIPKLSIVVATYRRPGHLKQLLNALQLQTAAPEGFEIVVVDNEIDSNQEVKELCTSIQYNNLHIRYFHQARPGLSCARNCGVMESRAELVAFLDDDMLPPNDWVTKVFDIRASSKAEAFGGPNTPYYTSTPPKWFKDKYASHNYGDIAHWLVKNKALIGGNSIWSRDLFLRFGGFSENFGYIGNKQRYGEDNELCHRVQQAGIGLWYDPTLNVMHHFEEKRMTVRWLMMTIMHHSQMKAHLVLRETRKAENRPVFMQVVSVARDFTSQFFRFLKVCLLALFRRKKEIPFLENYIIDRIGPEFRQVTLMFEMVYCLIFDNKEVRVGLK
jgi:glycosyltransferase involved in cell wall biosynthesis